MKGDHRFRDKPRGATGGGYARPRVQIGFNVETIKAVTALAKANNRSFAAEVRDLVAIGLKAKEPKKWREYAAQANGG